MGWRLVRLIFGIIILWICALLPALDFVSRFESPGRAVLQVPAVTNNQFETGAIIDEWRGVPVYHNGLPYWKSHGRHVAKEGYYYGKKWQCVEFIKRYYFDALGHVMPDVMGHAQSFFDKLLPHGALNRQRDLLQFKNGSNDVPQPDDLIVWSFGRYGHVAIVTRVTKTHVIVVQQNVESGSRGMLPLKTIGDQIWVGEPEWQPIGWLRQQEKSNG